MSILYDIFDLYVVMFSSTFYNRYLFPLLCFTCVISCVWLAHRIIDFKR